MDRYKPQRLVRWFGDHGQEALMRSRVLVVGCGGLGTNIAQHLVRAGVGHLRLVDDDRVDVTNLQRQLLYIEADLQDTRAKVNIAAERLAAMNSSVDIEPIVARLDSDNAMSLTADCHVLVDAMDNFEGRFVLNDAAVRRGLPWVHAGVVAESANSMTILPTDPSGRRPWMAAGGPSPCFCCMFDRPPSVGSVPTGSTAGVFGPAVAMIAGFQSMEVIKLLAGLYEQVARDLLTVDLLANTVRRHPVQAMIDRDCRCCGRRQWDYLSSIG